MNFRAKLRADPVGFQLAPMIDVVFLLLCFFMTSQLFAQWEQEIDITLPTAKTGQTPQRLPGEIIVNILADGHAVVNGRDLDDPSLAGMLKRLAGLFPGQPVLLRADGKLALQDFVSTVDAIKQQGFAKVNLEVERP